MRERLPWIGGVEGRSDSSKGKVTRAPRIKDYESRSQQVKVVWIPS